MRTVGRAPDAVRKYRWSGDEGEAMRHGEGAGRSWKAAAVDVATQRVVCCTHSKRKSVASQRDDEERSEPPNPTLLGRPSPAHDSSGGPYRAALPRAYGRHARARKMKRTKRELRQRNQ